MKDFSPIKINKWGEKSFSMTLETKQAIDGQLKTKRENIKVKVRYYIKSTLSNSVQNLSDKVRKKSENELFSLV